MKLGRRLASAFVLLSALAIALVAGGLAFDVLLGVAVGVGAWEFAGLMRRLDAEPPAWLLYPLTAWLLFRFLLPAAVPALEIGLGGALVAGVLGTLVRARPASRSWLGLAAALGGALYLGLCGGYYLALMRWHVPDPHREGLRIVWITLTAAIVGDSAALAVGSAFGRHPFFPRLSPRKTLEGALGSLAGSVAVVTVAAPLLLGLSPWLAALLGGVISVAAQGGDLAESALKRQAGAKDSSGLIPGHGGVLDRLDSLVLLGPAVYCFLRVVALP
ncbi:MAG: phosphatidate cytidylyltransferase [Candidatus Dormibacteria bacterium]